MKNVIRKLTINLVLLSAPLMTTAQEITVNLMPVQRILPPQVMLYINNPGNFFNVQLVNNSQVTQNVYMAMTIEQIHPYSGMHVIVPAKRQPQTPLTIAPGQVRQLTMVELKNMFNHVVKSEVQTTPGLFDSFFDGKFGNFPEGLYEARLTVYKWDPDLANPVPVSNPITGKCQFTVCYKAQAPQFIQPMTISTELHDLSVAKLNRQNPQLTWREPVLACNALAQRYIYDIKIVELMIGQQPDDAMDYNPAVYQQRGIMTPVAIIPKVSLDQMKKDRTYIAQVTARPNGSSARMLNYSMIENDGKSHYRMFRVVDSEFDQPEAKEPKPQEVAQEPKPNTQEVSQATTLKPQEVYQEPMPESKELVHEPSQKPQDAGKNIGEFLEFMESDSLCSAKVRMTNVVPTAASDAQLKGRTVGIGQYQMVIDEIRKVNGKDFYEGKGHVEWKPLGFRNMVAVKFDSLKINTDNIVYAGCAVTDMSISEKMDVSKYYARVRIGLLACDQFLKGEVNDLRLPVQIPKDYNSSPLDIQIVSMKFMPAYATMNILGELVLPNGGNLSDEILLLGSSGLCVAPDQLLPESGMLVLPGDITVSDSHSLFDMTFKAPTSAQEPANGCCVRWNNNKFATFDADIDIAVPGLVRLDAADNRTAECPVLNFRVSISDWDDWFAETQMDGFEAADLKNWTFVPGDRVVYDHSLFRNVEGMKLPPGFDKVRAGLQTGDPDAVWQGLYISKTGILFPRMLTVNGKNSSGRQRLEGKDMLVDASGCSLQFSADNLCDINKANIGGWAASVKELKLDVLQNTFENSYFAGQIRTPLDGLVAYRCDLYAQGKDARGMTDLGRSAYILNTQQIDGLRFGFWQGDMKFDNSRTYFLVMSGKDTAGADTTKVELRMGGDMTIAVDRARLKAMGKAGSFVDSRIPGISVDGMRIANSGRDFSIKFDNFSFSPGRWSLPSGSLGCFDFSPTGYKFDHKFAQKQAVLTVDGRIGLMGGQLSAGCGLDIIANADTNKPGLGFSTVKYARAKFNSEFGGITMKGSLDPFDGDENGYSGEMEFALPGGFLALKARGGYFMHHGETDDITWGYFQTKELSGTGLRLNPIVVSRLSGGFYFNCRVPMAAGDIPGPEHVRRDVNGAVLGVGLATSGTDKMLSADMDLTAVYDNKRRKLSPIYLTGMVDSLSTSADGRLLASEKIQMAYVNDMKKYIGFNVTAGGGATLDSETRNTYRDFTGRNFDAGRALRTSNTAAPMNLKVTMDESGPSKLDLYIGKSTKSAAPSSHDARHLPPTAPAIKYIEVDHPDERHAYATIFFEVDTVEADLKGYLPLYRHDRIHNGEWYPLTNSFTSPGGTVMRVDVSGLPTGEVCVASYDESGYQGVSVPQMIMLEDYLPPSAPTNLRAKMSPEGRMELRWDASPDAEVAFYEVFAANDSLGTFMNLSNDRQTETLFIDTLATGLNQAYVYYKVRAVDFSGNSSDDSDTLRVVRPNLNPPTPCRIDSLWTDGSSVTMHWLQSGEADLECHRVLRRLESDDEWTLLAVCSADSVRRAGGRIRLTDSPRPDVRTRYVYAVETVNLSGMSSGLSMPQTFLVTGPRLVDVPLKLFGNFTKKDNETLLAWETGRVPDYGPWHYSIYRKGSGDSDFRFFLSAKSTDSQFSDYLLRPGQEAEYYIVVQYADGRRSQRSNVVKVNFEL